MPILTYDEVLSRLQNVRKRGSQVVARCPVCGSDDHLYVSNKNGILLMYCQKCNAPFEELIKALLKDGPPMEQPEKATKNNGKIVEEYFHEYKNPDGSTAYYKKRIKYENGSKKFNFVYKNAEGKTIFSKPPNANNLYNLDLLKKAAPETTLYIVEGEKCADAMTKAGCLATTSNTGAQKNIKFSDIDKAMLRKFNRKILLPDNDEKGKDYASAWTDCQILRLTSVWPECPPKGDIADYLEQGLPIEKITSYEFPDVITLDKEYFEKLDKFQMIDIKLFEAINSVEDPVKRQSIQAMANFRATALEMVREFTKCYKAYNVAQAQKNVKSDNVTKFPAQPFAINCGEWTADMNGVRKIQSTNGSDFKFIFASPIPIMPTEILVNAEENTEKLRIGYFKDGAWRSVVVARSLMANAGKIVELADLGVEVNSDNAKLLVKYIADCVAMNPSILPRTKSISHMGWGENTFIPYSSDIKLDCEDQYKTLIGSVKEKGTLEDWIAIVEPLLKNIYLRLTVAASLASPLIEKIGALPFVLHLWGGTGSGKTVGAMVAASVWGDPRFGHLVRTMNMTINSMMSTAAVLRNIPFFGDELQTIKSRFENYDQLIMRVTEGIDRGRMNNYATLQKQNTWMCSFIFTGEEPCTKSGSGGGVKNRVVEIECNAPLIENGNVVVNKINNCFGVLGPAYIEKLHKRQLAKAYQWFFEKLLKKDTTEKQAMAMALIMLADDILQKEFMPNLPVLEIEDVEPFLCSNAEVDVAERAYETTLNIIAENEDKFAQLNYDAKSNVIWGKITSNKEIYFNKTVLERELEKVGFDFASVKRKWSDRGYLEKNTQGRLVWSASAGGIKANFIKIKEKS